MNQQPNPFDQFCVIYDIHERTNGLISENRIRHLIKTRDKRPNFMRCLNKVGREWVINLPELHKYIIGDQDES
jgi:hypothetical protein